MTASTRVKPKLHGRKNVAKGSEHALEMKAVNAEDPKGGFFLPIGLERLWVLASSLL